MGKDYIETIPRQVKDAELASDAIDHTAIADSFIKTDSGDPAASNDTGEGYVVGSLWVNTTTGDQFICTAITAEDATWINQEGDDINPIFALQGTNNGWLVGGQVRGPSPVTRDYIVQFAFASPVAGTDVGETATPLVQGTKGSIRDSTAGFIVGGVGPEPVGYQIDTMERFTFTAPSTVTDVGEYTVGAIQATGTSTNGTHGFIFGGSAPSAPGNVDTQTKLAFTAPYAQSDNGELTNAGAQVAGHSDLTYSYRTGSGYPFTNIIERFPFAATSGTYSDVGDLTTTVGYHGSASGPTHGLVHGGYAPIIDKLERFEFASSGNASDIGEAIQKGQSSGSNGPDAAYFVGGNTTPTSAPSVDTATKVPWATTSGGGTDVGEIAVFDQYGFENGSGGYEN